MKLSQIERLLLYNQFRILEALYPDEDDYHTVKRIALEEGYTLHYPDLTECFYDELSKEECKEVIECLDMFRSLYFSYKRLPNKAGINSADVTFVGFDGNEEPKQYRYAKYYMYDLDRFQEFHNESRTAINSHWPKLEEYRRMLAVWKTFPKGASYELTEVQFLQILNAK